MDPPAFKLPSRDPQVLHPLSPERVNGTRPRTARSVMASRNANATDPESTENPSPRLSPTRKANLFADYNPNGRALPSESIFGPGAMPTSPSLPELHAFRTHTRTNSDVQGLVKRFEHLDVRDRDAENAERRKKHEAELHRAQVAREEAESDSRRLREEVRRLKKENDDGHDRERKVAKRLDVVMDEFTRSKETSASQITVYEKEVRKARKEAFKSSSAVLKLQEDLKSTRATLRVAQANLDMEKRKIQHKEQETFDAQYQLVAVQEELEKVKTHYKIVQEEKEALKTSLKEEEVARIAAEGLIALPVSAQDEDDLLSPSKRRSPQKSSASPLSDDKENAGVITKKMFETRQMQEELRWERLRREQAEELADFLRMECTFRCCGCRTCGPHEMLSVAESFSQSMEHISRAMRETLKPLMTENVNPKATADVDMAAGATDTKTDDIEMDLAPEPDFVQQLDRSLTMARESPEPQPTQEIGESARNDDDCAVEDDEGVEMEGPKAPHPTPNELEMHISTPTETTKKVPLSSPRTQTPTQPQASTPFRQQTSVRTITTTTTTIPVQFTPAKPYFHHEDAENAPPSSNPISPRDRSGSAPTFDRAAALAAIAYRRGRAKSIANGHVTPRKQMIEGVSLKERRDISAPALGQKKSGTANLPKGSASVGRGTAGSARRVG